VLALDLLLTAEDEGGGTVAGTGAEQQHVLALMADATLGTALEIDSTAQNFIGTAGQHTGGVHLAQGIPAGVDGHVVEVQHVIAVAEVDGIEIVLALVMVQQRAGTAGDDGAAQLNADLLHAGGGALLNGNGIPAAGMVAQQLHLHQNYMRTLGGADAGQVGGDAALGIAAQAVNPSVLTTGFGLSLSILAMYLTINNPCACMDSLTGLNDKQYLLRRMDELTDAHKAFHIITVYAYQLDHMNKIAGMRGGDEFLRRAAERMQEIAGRNVFRVTGRRFLLLTFSLREYETCLTRLRQLFHTQPDDAQSAPTPVILCGVVNAEKLGTSGLVLDYAEYLESLVSQSGETQVIQNDRKTMDSFHYNKQVEQFLHRAIEEDLFEVYYQPVYSLHRQRYVTLEALSRLRHPELGWISPDIFIRLAEKNHLITQITELQLRRVCRFLRENPALRASIANVKINLSPLDLIHSESGSHLVRILGEYGLPCSCFQFEITETVATEYSASLTRVAESLQAAGIGLCLDDFGSGYANLNTVMQLPFSVIKLDRSLLFHICTDKNAALFYQSIVSAFCRLGYRIVAEGVETQEEMELLRSWNVDMIQGYYFSRPLPPDDLLRLLTGSAEMQAENQA